jgi:hypothetical protein
LTQVIFNNIEIEIADKDVFHRSFSESWRLWYQTAGTGSAIVAPRDGTAHFKCGTEYNTAAWLSPATISVIRTAVRTLGNA